MKRRDFIKGLLATSAVATVAPAVLAKGTELTIEHVRSVVFALRYREVAWTSESYFCIVSPNRMVFFSDVNDPESWDVIEPVEVKAGTWQGVRFIENKPLEAEAA